MTILILIWNHFQKMILPNTALEFPMVVGTNR